MVFILAILWNQFFYLVFLLADFNFVSYDILGDKLLNSRMIIVIW